TPLGMVEVDSKFAAFLVNNSEFFKSDETAHACEHSIEVQIPFLQYLMEDFKILPICLGSMDMNKLKKIASELATAIKKTKRDAVIIASSDMTHYETHESAKKKDMQAISAILNMDGEELFETIRSMNITMCGAAPMAVTLIAAKSLGAKNAELVDYKTSGDSSGDYSSVVGYGGIIIK
ncbi:MAG: AmmeMemoRadiSam system protein B, partial [Candidatus Omnitrophota bacterium]|nr:AmmeMemoRadiSam system protein B [Candidatus Omnitrophota bacterium]